MYIYLLVICVPAPPSVGNVFFGGMLRIGWQYVYPHTLVGKMRFCMHDG
jgi:hypothetical protein